MCLDRANRLSGVSGRAPDHLAPKPVRREVDLVIPHQITVFAYARVAEIIVVFPGRVNTCMRLFGKIHFALDTVIKSDPDAVSIQNANFS